MEEWHKWRMKRELLLSSARRCALQATLDPQVCDSSSNSTPVVGVSMFFVLAVCQATCMSASQAVGSTHHQFDLAAPVDSRCYLRNLGDNLVSSCATIPEQQQFAGTVAGAPLVMPLAGSLFSGYPLMEPVAFVPPKSSADGIRYGEQCPHNPSHLMYPWNPCPNQESPPVRAADSDNSEWNVFFGAERMNHECRAVNYKNLLKLTSLSVKVFNCTPGDLPPTLKSQLLQAVMICLKPIHS